MGQIIEIIKEYYRHKRFTHNGLVPDDCPEVLKDNDPILTGVEMTCASLLRSLACETCSFNKARATATVDINKEFVRTTEGIGLVGKDQTLNDALTIK